VMTMTASS